MKKLFLFLFLAFGTLGTYAQIVYEDFQGAAKLTWTGINGTYNGQVANPDPTGANTSNGVGSYTNNPDFDFNFAIADLGQPADLSQFNLFKMKIWSPTAPAKMLLKFEGGGKNVEKIIDISEANKWVEYEFDLSGGSGFTTMNKVLVSFNSFVKGDTKTYFFDDIIAVKNQRCYADFDGSGIEFKGLDGVLTAPFDNPGANKVNSSAKCAKYVKSDKHAYSLILADNGAPFDLKVYNQFKIDVYATAATQMIFKIEGSGGGFEKKVNIAVKDAWQTYTFDFSAQADNTGLSKIVMFFDFGVEASSDTYYFDNVCAVPQGSCKGVVLNPSILDDFECNRTAIYEQGWDSLSVVKNPAPTGDNNSAAVGKYLDPSGPGTEYSALVIDYQEPLDLSAKNEFSCKVWSAKAGDLLLKIEGGPNPAKEVKIPMTELNKWVEYKADFSDMAGKGHRRLVLFFNAGQNGAAGDTYYVDDIRLGEPSALPPLEDFQTTPTKLFWQPLEQNTALHGNFTAPTSNPGPNTVNGSTQVGCYAKGTSPLSTLQAFAPAPFDLKVFPQFNIDVRSPQGGGKVKMQLSSALQGNKEAEATIKTPGEWETLSFDFSAFSAVTDFLEVRLIFNAGTAAAGQSWCIDNLRQTKITIDPCLGTVPVANVYDDFECQRNKTVGAGNDRLKVINNPKLNNDNGSLKVGQYTDPANEPWVALCYEVPEGVDLSLYNFFSVQVYGPAKVPMLFKLEGGTSPAKEIWDTLRTGEKWQKFNIDFSGEAGKNHKRICIFFNAGQSNPETVYYVDNVRWARAGYSGCVVDNETPTLINTWRYFANGALEVAGYQFEIVDNPTKAGINTSTKVGKFVRAGNAEVFAGIYSSPDLESPIDWKGNKKIRAKVLMDHIGNLGLKVEGSATGAPPVELKVANTKINEWEEITVDFAAAPDNGEYKRLTLFFDLGLPVTGKDVTSYFDDIVIGNGACGVSGTFYPNVEPLSLAPNPAFDMITLRNSENLSRVEVFNAYGQRVAMMQTQGDSQVDIDLSRFPAGVYSLAGYDRQGVLVGNAKFVKQ